MDFISDFFSTFGLTSETQLLLVQATTFLILLLGAIIVNYITKSILLGIVEKVIRKTKTNWDDVFLENHVLDKISHFAPVLFFDLMTPVFFENNPDLLSTLNSIVLITLIIFSLKLINALINSGYQIYLQHDLSKEIPIKGFVQVLKIVNYFVGGVFFISVIIDKSPFYLLSGLGALTAVLLFVFKDVLLGLIAGIQLTANKMVRHGDWVEMPKYGVDGEVLDISLTTVKVENWDKTITTIPTYALISESFKNWRGMTDAGGRRIKRAIQIDVNSIGFCSNELIKKLKDIDFLDEYLSTKLFEIEEYNSKDKINLNSLVNGRRLTNVGVFRIYVKEYLKRNSNIRKDMTFLIRQLPPTSEGLPIEIYVFSSETAWGEYENIQADIFDHLFAALKEFDLKLYQQPSGNDFQKLGK